MAHDAKRTPRAPRTGRRGRSLPSGTAARSASAPRRAPCGSRPLDAARPPRASSSVPTLGACDQQQQAGRGRTAAGHPSRETLGHLLAQLHDAHLPALVRLRVLLGLPTRGWRPFQPAPARRSTPGRSFATTLMRRILGVARVGRIQGTSATRNRWVSDGRCRRRARSRLRGEGTAPVSPRRRAQRIESVPTRERSRACKSSVPPMSASSAPNRRRQGVVAEHERAGARDRRRRRRARSPRTPNTSKNSGVAANPAQPMTAYAVDDVERAPAVSRRTASERRPPVVASRPASPPAARGEWKVLERAVAAEGRTRRSLSR